MLSEKLDDWTEQWKKEGVEAGRKEGLKLGLEQGLEQGRKQEAAAMLTRFLTKRFGPLDESTQEQVGSASVEQIEAWSDRVLDASTLAEVFKP